MRLFCPVTSNVRHVIGLPRPLQPLGSTSRYRSYSTLPIISPQQQDEVKVNVRVGSNGSVPLR
ncbi:MAG: hypothetical protein L6R39_005023, partial [Caloplaca ligustica]